MHFAKDKKRGHRHDGMARAVTLGLLTFLGTCLVPSLSANEAFSETYVFEGPFSFARSEREEYVVGLSQPISDSRLAGQIVRLRKVQVTANVVRDSNESFPFDCEVLIFDGAVHSSLHAIRGRELADLDRARQYAALRRRAHVNMLNTSGGRSAGTQEPIEWTLNLTDLSHVGVANVFEAHTGPFTTTSPEGPTFQVLFWTLSGGTHLVELRDIALYVEMDTTEPAAKSDPEKRRILLILAYTFTGVIVATAILTLLSLIGVVKFQNPKQQEKLYWVLIVELVLIAVAWFRGWLS